MSVVQAIERLEKNIPGQCWDLLDCDDVKTLVASLVVEWHFTSILRNIEHHHVAHPDHGINCACMDEYVRLLRNLTVSTVAQRRIDYVLRKAVER